MRLTSYDSVTAVELHKRPLMAPLPVNGKEKVHCEEPVVCVDITVTRSSKGPVQAVPVLHVMAGVVILAGAVAVALAPGAPG